MNYFILLFLVLKSLVGLGQEQNIAIGQWRVHLPFDRMDQLAASPNGVYTSFGSSVYYIDKAENSGEVVSKFNGLNDVVVSALGYNVNQKNYILGYESGNIDLINGNKTTLVNDISRASIVGSKRINHLFTFDDQVLISGDFGVVLYDLKKKEVKESFLTLTPNFTSNKVVASTLSSDRDSLFIATEKGLLVGRFSSNVNLMDYSNWYLFQESDSIDNVNISSVCTYNGVVYASVDFKGIYFFNGSKWRKMNIPFTSANTHSLVASSNGILACVDSTLYQITSPTAWSILFQQNNITPMMANYDNENTLWIASFYGGVIKVANGNTNFYQPSGPLTTASFRFGYYNNTLVSLAGGYNFIGQKAFQLDAFSYFEDNTQWKVGLYEYPSLPSGLTDYISATYNEFNSKLYLSCYGEGLLAINKDKQVTIYNNLNSPIKKQEGTGPNLNTFVGETSLDKEGTLWVPNTFVALGQSNFHALASDGTWKSFTISNSLSKNMISVLIDESNQKWIKATGSSSQSGIIVFDDKENRTRVLTAAAGQGGLPDTKVNCIAIDSKGSIIVGTDKGLAICYEPSIILNPGVDLVTPIYEGFPILFDRSVTAIEVDGGNRKWIGTNKGLWLFNEDFTQQLNYFDVDNSPLLSDNILAIKVHPKTGEVFFATARGIVSLRGFATAPDETYSDVKVFPNPVKPGFNGFVGISGLAENVIVKITDVAGNLMYETKANGGTATWNVKDYNGKRASTGVYLIFCAKDDGTTTFVSKIAVVE